MHNIDYSFIHSFLKMSKSVFNFNAFKNVAHGRNRRHTAYSRSKFFMHFFFRLSFCFSSQHIQQ